MNLSLEDRIRIRTDIMKYRAFAQAEMEIAHKSMGGPMDEMIMRQCRINVVDYERRATQLEVVLATDRLARACRQTS